MSEQLWLINSLLQKMVLNKSPGSRCTQNQTPFKSNTDIYVDIVFICPHSLTNKNTSSLPKLQIKWFRDACMAAWNDNREHLQAHTGKQNTSLPCSAETQVFNGLYYSNILLPYYSHWHYNYFKATENT